MDSEEENFNVLNFLMIGQHHSHISRHAIRDKGETRVEFINEVLSGHPEYIYFVAYVTHQKVESS